VAHLELLLAIGVKYSTDPSFIGENKKRRGFPIKNVRPTTTGQRD
jgi:hypothetical protein